SNLPPEEWQAHVMTWVLGPGLNDFPNVFAAQSQTLSQRDLKPSGWRFGTSVNRRLLEQMRVSGKPLGEVVEGKIFAGVKTGLNKAFVVSTSTRSELIREDANSAEIIKPYIRGKHLDKWSSESSGQFIIYTPRGIAISAYPAIKKHLTNFKRDLEQRA